MPNNTSKPVELIELDIGWGKITLYMIALRKPLSPGIIASIDKQYPECTIVGVTEDVTPCKVGLALLYTQEDIITGRARVKNPTLLLLLNTYGFKQIKDILNNIKYINKIIIINCNINYLKSIILSLSSILGEHILDQVGHVDIPSRHYKCSGKELYSITSNRLNVILK